MADYIELFRKETSDMEEVVKSKEIYVKVITIKIQYIFSIKEKSGSFEEILKSYLEDAKGPYKYRIVSDHIPSLLFELFDSWFEALNSHFMSEINKSKVINYLILTKKAYLL